MYQQCLQAKGCVVEWNDGTYSFFNGLCNLIGFFRFMPDLTDLTVHTISGIKLSRKRKPVRVYYIPKSTTQEVLHNNFVGVKNDYIEGLSGEESETERNDSSDNAGNDRV